MKSVKRTCIAAIAFVAALAIPAEAKIVYHKANINIQPNSSYNLDLNHDGVTDFTISTHLGFCLSRSTSETPVSGNGVDYFAIKSGPPASNFQGHRENGFCHRLRSSNRTRLHPQAAGALC